MRYELLLYNFIKSKGNPKNSESSIDFIKVKVNNLNEIMDKYITQFAKFKKMEDQQEENIKSISASAAQWKEWVMSFLNFNYFGPRGPSEASGGGKTKTKKN